MNEVRLVCEQLLDGPEPPLGDAGELLQRARKSKRRRTALLSGTAAAVIAVTAAFVVDQPRRTPEPAIPVAQVAAVHGSTMAQQMVAAVPATYMAVPETTFSSSLVIEARAGGPPRILAGAVVRVFTGPREGQLYAYLVRDGQPVPPGDLCAAVRAGGHCETRTVNGIPLRLVTYTDPKRGQVIEATRFLRDGRLIVGSVQSVQPDLQRYVGPNVYEPRQSLTAPPLDASRLASLAADPAMASDG
jgi:hypothetical protein